MRQSATVVLCLAVACVSGCERLVQLESPAPSSAVAFGNKRLVVTRRDSSRVTITGARVVGDSLIGVDADSLDRTREAPVRVALGDVARLETRRPTWVTWALIAYVGVGLTGAVICAATSCTY